MKKFLIILLLSINVNAQTVKHLSDPYIVNQAKRDVMYSWAPFTPDQKYKKTLGVKYKVPSPHFEFTWAAWAPRQNRRYRRGKDIRPLAINGDLTKADLSTQLMREIDKEYIKVADDIGKSELETMMYYTNLGGEVSEPFWNLFYKKYLDEVYKYKNVLTYVYQKKNDINKYFILYSNETIREDFDRDMKIFQERIKAALTINMERGGRILNLHKIYLEYISFKNSLEDQLNFYKVLNSLQENKIETKYKQEKGFKNETGTDRELMREIILDAKINYKFRQ